MALIHEWKIESIAAADNAAIDSWPPTVGAIALNQPVGVAQPLYKTKALSSGKAALRFDGSNDALASVTPITGAKHWFLVAAYRPATNPGTYAVLFDIGNGGPFYLDGSGLLFIAGTGVHYRDGIATNAVYGSGQFALYESYVAGGQTGAPWLGRNSAGSNGPYDVAYIGIYDTEQTGSTLTAIRTALTSNYLISASGDEQLQRRRRSNRGR